MGDPGSVAVTSETLGARQHNDLVAHDRRSRDDGHVLIGGTGRAGTTVLVQYFTVLGFDTGYTVDEAMARVDPISRGGLEHSLGRGNLAYVSKSPWFGNHLGERIETGELAVRWMIVPIRELHAAAESRREVSRRAEESGRDPHSQPGGLSFGAKGKPKQQEQRLGVQLYRLVHTLARTASRRCCCPSRSSRRTTTCCCSASARCWTSTASPPRSRWRRTSGSSTPATSPNTRAAEPAGQSKS